MTWRDYLVLALTAVLSVCAGLFWWVLRSVSRAIERINP